MPSFKTRFVPAGTTPQPAYPTGLTVIGPVTQGQVELPSVLAQALVGAGTPLPNPVVGPVLFDTGAGISCIDAKAAGSLGLQPIGTTVLAGAVGAGQQRPLYAALVRLFGGQLNVELTGAAEADLSPFGIVALIGRDVLDKMTLIYDGTQGEFTVIL